MYLSRNYVFKEILPHPLVKNDERCTSVVLDAMEDVSSGSEDCYFAEAPRNCLRIAEDCLVISSSESTIPLPSHRRQVI